MIKRLVKKKDSKQGAILVIVVLILALAMIFITAAMMLTQATRGRLYENTLKSQARLTVTSASEVFLEALITQEITDQQIDKMLEGNEGAKKTDADKIKMVVDGVPGMSTDPENCTYLDLYYPDKADHSIVWADFSTIIGEERENVRVVLHVKDSKSHLSGRFKNQIEVAASVSTSQLRFTEGVGMVNPALGEVDNNTILLRSGSYEQTSDSVFFSDMVYAGGTAVIGGGNYFKGNMVFLDNAYLQGVSDVKELSGNCYFIGKTNHDYALVFGQAGTWDAITSKNFVFSGRTAQKSNDTDNCYKIRDCLNKRTCYFIGDTNDTISCSGGSGAYTVTNSKNPDSTITDKLKLYESKQYDYTNNNNPYPSNAIEDVFAQINTTGNTRVLNSGYKTIQDEYWCVEVSKNEYEYHVIYEGTTLDKDYEVYADPITATYPKTHMNYNEATKTYSFKSGTQLSLNQLAAKANADGVVDLAPGYYQFTSGSTCHQNDAHSKPIVIAINGKKASEYRFYFAAGQHDLNNCVFAMYNVQPNQTPIIFVLEPNAKVQCTTISNFRKGTDDVALCASGFLCMDRGFTNADDLTKYIRDKNVGYENITWSTDHTGKNGAQIQYSKYYDGEAKPSFYILASDSSEFGVGDSVILEAYIGLYGNSGFTQAKDIASTIAIYGRIEADYFKDKADNPTGNFQMPYCPAPGSLDEDPEMSAAKTKFEIAQIIYYY